MAVSGAQENNMTIKDLIDTLENGATKLTIYDDETGELFFKSIWYNLIAEDLKNKKIKRIVVTDYQLKIGI